MLLFTINVKNMTFTHIKIIREIIPLNIPNRDGLRELQKRKRRVQEHTPPEFRYK